MYAYLRSMDERGVIFATKGGRECTLSGVDCLRRFVDHLLPKDFTRIRYYGLLAPCHATTTLGAGARAAHAEADHHHHHHHAEADGGRPWCRVPSVEGAPPTWVERLLAWTGIDADRCARCGAGRLVRQPLDGRPTPSSWDTS